MRWRFYLSEKPHRSSLTPVILRAVCFFWFKYRARVLARAVYPRRQRHFPSDIVNASSAFFPSRDSGGNPAVDPDDSGGNGRGKRRADATLASPVRRPPHRDGGVRTSSSFSGLMVIAPREVGDRIAGSIVVRFAAKLALDPDAGGAAQVEATLPQPAVLKPVVERVALAQLRQISPFPVLSAEAVVNDEKEAQNACTQFTSNVHSFPHSTMYACICACIDFVLILLP